MKLQILGTGCAKCNALTLAAEQAAQTLGVEYELEKVTDLNRIMSFGVMITPALVDRILGKSIACAGDEKGSGGKKTNGRHGRLPARRNPRCNF